MSREEIINFACAGQPLIGILHRPENAIDTGLLCIVARGAQYRVGCCRQQVILGRSLAECGIPVMRFDYRGLGDCAGEASLHDRSEDIGAAVDAFLASMPEIKQVVLYGGCDGASAVALSGWRHPAISGWILNNPSIGEAGTGSRVDARVTLRHYYRERLRSREFWSKLLHLRMDLRGTITSLWRNLRNAFSSSGSTASTASDNPFAEERPLVDRMLAGWQRFDGEVLLLMGGRSVVARIFDEWVTSSKPWQTLVQRPQVTRVNLTNADHTFSEPASRELLAQSIANWFLSRD